MKLKARCWCESPPWSLADTCVISTSAIKHLTAVVGLVTLVIRGPKPYQEIPITDMFAPGGKVALEFSTTVQNKYI